MPRALPQEGVSRAVSQGADYSITILNEKFKRKVISVDPSNGYVRELELSLTCEVTVRDKDGNVYTPANLEIQPRLLLMSCQLSSPLIIDRCQKTIWPTMQLNHSFAIRCRRFCTDESFDRF